LACKLRSTICRSTRMLLSNGFAWFMNCLTSSVSVTFVEISMESTSWGASEKVGESPGDNLECNGVMSLILIAKFGLESTQQEDLPSTEVGAKTQRICTSAIRRRQPFHHYLRISRTLVMVTYLFGQRDSALHWTGIPEQNGERALNILKGRTVQDSRQNAPY